MTEPTSTGRSMPPISSMAKGPHPAPSPEPARTEHFDVVIVGCGSSGLYAALNLPRHLRVLMLCKTTVDRCDSMLAQGGICVLLDEADYDSFYEDTMRAGHYENRPESVDIMIRSSRRVLDHLVTLGVDFARTPTGELDYTREGGHSRPRICYHADTTGREITSALLRAVRALPNVEIREHACMTDLIEEGGACAGVMVEDGSDPAVLAFAQTAAIECSRPHDEGPSIAPAAASHDEGPSAASAAASYGEGSSAGPLAAESASRDQVVAPADSAAATSAQPAVPERFAVRARFTILATGGIGGLYAHSTNYPEITGDACRIAREHGVRLEHMDYVQIHPTSLYTGRPGRAFLISESARGEGAVLLNAAGERFTDELKPRDVVSAAIFAEMQREGSDHVWLSFDAVPREVITGHFAAIYEHCLKEGYDITREPIPVVPAQHYFMGGIAVDTHAKTSMPRLFAVGETSCNGVHGKNRLASNSLLEALVFARRAAHAIEETCRYETRRCEGGLV